MLIYAKNPVVQKVKTKNRKSVDIIKYDSRELRCTCLGESLESWSIPQVHDVITRGGRRLGKATPEDQALPGKQLLRLALPSPHP